MGGALILKIGCAALRANLIPATTHRAAERNVAFFGGRGIVFHHAEFSRIQCRPARITIGWALEAPRAVAGSIACRIRGHGALSGSFGLLVASASRQSEVLESAGRRPRRFQLYLYYGSSRWRVHRPECKLLAAAAQPNFQKSTRRAILATLGTCWRF